MGFCVWYRPVSPLCYTCPLYQAAGCVAVPSVLCVTVLWGAVFLVAVLQPSASVRESALRSLGPLLVESKIAPKVHDSTVLSLYCIFEEPHPSLSFF